MNQCSQLTLVGLVGLSKMGNLGKPFNLSLCCGFRCFLLVDISNAFNSIDRKCMFVEARSRILSMSAWLECYYGIQPILHFGDDIIHSYWRGPAM